MGMDSCNWVYYIPKSFDIEKHKHLILDAFKPHVGDEYSTLIDYDRFDRLFNELQFGTGILDFQNTHMDDEIAFDAVEEFCNIMEFEKFSCGKTYRNSREIHNIAKYEKIINAIVEE